VILEVFDATLSVKLVILAVLDAMSVLNINSAPSALFFSAVIANSFAVILAVFDAIFVVLIVILEVFDDILVSKPLIVLELTPPILFTVVLNVPEPLPVTSPVKVIN
jgi:hypothetical protein